MSLQHYHALDMFLDGKLHDESSGVRHVRRMFHPGRGLGGPRARRSNMHFTSSTTGGLSTSQSSSQSSSYSREAMDPIAGQSHNVHTGTEEKSWLHGEPVLTCMKLTLQGHSCRTRSFGALCRSGKRKTILVIITARQKTIIFLLLLNSVSPSCSCRRPGTQNTSKKSGVWHSYFYTFVRSEQVVLI